MEEKSKEILRLNLRYILVGILSIASIIIFPLIGFQDVDISTVFPTTLIGWIIWLLIRCLLVVLNILIFANLVSQAKINVRNNKKYIEATEILLKKKQNKQILSPQMYYKRLYAGKGVSLALTTIASLFAIGGSILTYDYMLLAATGFTILISIIFGLMTMKSTEGYLTTDYWIYAKHVESLDKKKYILAADINEILKNYIQNMEEYNVHNKQYCISQS